MTDTRSARSDRRELLKILDHIAPGDVVTARRIDRSPARRWRAEAAELARGCALVNEHDFATHNVRHARLRENK